MKRQKKLKIERLKKRFDIKIFLKFRYDSMINRINGHNTIRYKNLPILSRTEFYDWALCQGQLFVLYHEWNRRNHQRKYMPTIDRINPLGGYTLHNIRWLTQSKNSSIGGRIGGLNSWTSRRIIG